MAKSRANLQSIYNLKNYLKEDSFLPIYFFCGEDSYAIDGAVKTTLNALSPLIESEFDKEVVTLDKKTNSQQILDLVLSFPFGGGKKVIAVKNFENISDRNSFADYVKNPADFAILILTQNGKLNSTSSEPYKSLAKNGYIFEAKVMKGDELAEWLIKHAKRNKVTLTYENASALIEIVGEQKSLLETQLQKFYDNVGENGEITFDLIRDLASSTKMYTIFNLQDEIGRGNKTKALEIAYNLLDSGTDIGGIISPLTRYITINTQAYELKNKKIQQNEAASIAGVNPFYYKNCVKSNIFNSTKRLRTAAEALYKADYSVKTSAADSKTIISILISEMISN